MTVIAASSSTDQPARFSWHSTAAGVVEVAPVDPPDSHTRLKRLSLIFHEPTINPSTGRAVAWLPDESLTVEQDLGYVQVVVGAKDVTWFGGVPTLVGPFENADPFGDLACPLVFPSITTFDTPGAGRTAWLKNGAHVLIRIIHPDHSASNLWHGWIKVRRDAQERLVVEAKGPLYQADLARKMPSLVSGPRDRGTVIAEALNDVIGRDYGTCKPVTTGIPTQSRGSGTPVLTGFVQDQLGPMTTASGASSWTVKQTAWTPSLVVKNRTVVHATIWNNQPGAVVELSYDAEEGVNVIYGEGTAPDGCHWRNVRHPNLRPDDSPIYPLDPDHVFFPGSGTGGFAPFATEMRESGYRMYSGNTYDSRDEDEVRDAQRRGGILIDGIVGPQTWARVFEVGSNVGSLSGSYYAPLAIDARVDPWIYNAQGAKVGKNPHYDPNRIRSEIFINYGEGVSKHDAIQSARAQMLRSMNPGLLGTITLTADPQEISRWLLRSGMNIKVRKYRGADRVLHIAHVSADLEAKTVTVTVDEKARDLLTIAEIRARNKEATADPAGRASSQRRQSRLTSDSIVPWDCESGAGIIPRHALYGGLWTVLRIPAGQVGQIASLHITTSGPASEFAIGISSKPITAATMRRLVGNPFTSRHPFDPSYDALADAGLIYAWGGQDNPAGYSPGSKSEDSGLTGRLIDDSGFPYESDVPGWLWVCEYASDSCFIQGRLEASPEGF